MKKKSSSTYKNQNKPAPIINPEIGKLPPQAQELEQAVLGAILLESSALEYIELAPEDFYLNNNRLIFEAIQQLKSERKPIDILTVIEELQANKKLQEAGGPLYIADLSDKIASAAHIEYHAAIIKQKSVARKIITHSHEIIVNAYDESQDVGDTIELIEKSLTEIKTGSTAADYLNTKQAIQKTLKYLADIQARKEEGRSIAITTGLKTLDEQFNGGWTAPDLIILGGRPGMGKTQFALHFAKAAAKQQKHTLFISIEMTVEQLILRVLTEDERLHLYDMKTGQLDQEDWKAIDEKVSEFENDSLYIADDHNVRNLNNIKSLARKLHRQSRLDLLIIDYLQLIKTNQTFGTRDIEIGHITGELKNLAKELNIPVILLAQLNRPVKGAAVKPPVLSDLRESGNIEQDADKVIFPHRPTYYEPNAIDSAGRSWENRGVLIIGKDREGAKDGRIHFETDERFKKIFDYNSSAQQPEEDQYRDIYPF